MTKVVTSKRGVSDFGCVRRQTGSIDRCWGSGGLSKRTDKRQTKRNARFRESEFENASPEKKACPHVKGLLQFFELLTASQVLVAVDKCA